MTKVEELIQALEYHMDQDGEYELNTIGLKLLEELVQAVRKEEKDRLITGMNDCGQSSCSRCPLRFSELCQWEK